MQVDGVPRVGVWLKVKGGEGEEKGEGEGEGEGEEAEESFPSTPHATSLQSSTFPEIAQPARHRAYLYQKCSLSSALADTQVSKKELGWLEGGSDRGNGSWIFEGELEWGECALFKEFSVSRGVMRTTR